MTGHVFAMAMAALDVNGPEDGPLDWDAIQWCSVEKDVQRLRRRIFAATRAGDYQKVRSLQKLMLRSRSNIVVSVRQVTERNAGRVTAGVDGKVVLTSRSKERLVEHIQYSPDRIRPVKRVFIVRREALCCIPNTVGRNLEDRFWA
jgi:RNA-directed DNA polymerase